MAKKGRLCDFCAAMPAEWRYPVKEPVEYLNEPFLHQTADWYACLICSKMIEEEDMKGVMERSFAYHSRRHPIISRAPAMIKAHIYQLYVEFMKRRQGPRVIYDYRKE